MKHARMVPVGWRLWITLSLFSLMASLIFLTCQVNVEYLPQTKMEAQGHNMISTICNLLTKEEDHLEHKDILDDWCHWLMGLNNHGSQMHTKEYFETRFAQVRGLKQLQFYLMHHFNDDIESGGGTKLIITVISRIIVQFERVLERCSKGNMRSYLNIN